MFFNAGLSTVRLRNIRAGGVDGVFCSDLLSLSVLFGVELSLGVPVPLGQENLRFLFFGDSTSSTFFRGLLNSILFSTMISSSFSTSTLDRGNNFDLRSNFVVVSNTNTTVPLNVE